MGPEQRDTANIHIRISQSLPQPTVAPKPIDRAIRFYQYTPLGHRLLLSLQKARLPPPALGLQMFYPKALPGADFCLFL